LTYTTSVPSPTAPPWRVDGPVPLTPHPSQAGPRPLSAPGVSWVAAHGGAGASTLAKVLGGADLGCHWPDVTCGHPARILLVARTDVQGLRAAARSLNAVHEGRHPAGMGLVGLVLVADLPGRLPRELRSMIRELRSKVPTWRVSWVPQWRLGRQVEQLPRHLVKLGRVVQAAQQGGGR